MKALITAIGLSALLLIGCDPAGIVGSGVVVTEDRTVTDFKGIEVKPDVDVVIEKGASHALRVEADDNVIDMLKTDVVNGMLRVTMTNDEVESVNATVYITMPEVETVFNYGPGYIYIKDGFVADHLDIYMYGSGGIEIAELTADHVKSHIMGSGGLTLSGTVDKHNAQLKGSGPLKAHDMVTRESAIGVFGSGSAEIYVNEVLFADIFGSGDVIYDGEPRVSARESGTGRVKRWN